jgi:outer membrane protein assembly factor BamB
LISREIEEDTMRSAAFSIATHWMFIVSCFAPGRLFADDWSRFRGPDGTGLAAADQFPNSLDAEENLRWKVPSGKGASSPVVSGARVFLTAFEGEDRIVTCYDSNDGSVLWSKSFHAKRKEVATPPGSPVNSTPAADDSRVYVFFPDIGLIGLTHDGDERWQVPLGPFHSFHGIAASLVLAEGKVFVLADQLEGSFLAAFDCQTGDEAWKVGRLDGPIGGYSTPATRKTATGQTELIVSGPLEVVGYNAVSGAQNWSIHGATNAPVSVPVVSGNDIFVCEPSFSENPFKLDTLLAFDKNKDEELSFEELESHTPLYRIAKLVDKSWGNGDRKIQGDELDRAFKSFVGGGGLAAIHLDGSESNTTANVKWTYRKSIPQIASPIIANDVLFCINDGGILLSFNPATGAIIKRGRLGRGGAFYASPVAAAGKLLFADTDGELNVVSADGQWTVLATSQLGEACYATPEIAGGRIYIRGEQHLHCFGDAS